MTQTSAKKWFQGFSQYWLNLATIAILFLFICDYLWTVLQGQLTFIHNENLSKAESRSSELLPTKR